LICKLNFKGSESDHTLKPIENDAAFDSYKLGISNSKEGHISRKNMHQISFIEKIFGKM